MNMMWDNLLLKEIKKEKSDGGIYYPDKTKDEEVVTGEIIAVGPGKYYSGQLKTTVLKVGNRIAYNRRYGIKLRINGEEFVSLPEEYVIGVFETGEN